MGLPTDRQQILFNGQPLKDKDRLKAKGVHEGDLLFLTIGAPQPKPNTGGGGGLGIAAMIKNFDKQKREGGGDFRMLFPEKPI